MARRLIVVGLALATVIGIAGTTVVAVNSFAPTASVQALPAVAQSDSVVAASADPVIVEGAASPGPTDPSRQDVSPRPSGPTTGHPRAAETQTHKAVTAAGASATGPSQPTEPPTGAKPTVSGLVAGSTTADGRQAASCAVVPAGLGSATAAKVAARTTQIVLTVGKGIRSSYSAVQFWSKEAGCWRMDHSTSGRNGYAGWHPHPWDGSGYSPIGMFSLTDAGGRLPNPGTKLPYHYGPKAYASGGYRMNNNPAQVFDYVVAVNFNRYKGRHPRDDGRPDPRTPDGGIWFHVAGAGATRGCISIPKKEMVLALRWLNPAARPIMVMGPAARLAR